MVHSGTSRRKKKKKKKKEKKKKKDREKEMETKKLYPACTPPPPPPPPPPAPAAGISPRRGFPYACCSDVDQSQKEGTGGEGEGGGGAGFSGCAWPGGRADTRDTPPCGSCSAAVAARARSYRAPAPRLSSRQRRVTLCDRLSVRNPAYLARKHAGIFAVPRVGT